MYSFQHNDKADIAGLLDMVRRGCERLYSLQQCTAPEKVRRWNHEIKHPRMTNNQKDAAIMLARTGKYTATQIAKLIGHTQSAVFKFLVKKNGMTLRDGRHDKKKATP